MTPLANHLVTDLDAEGVVVESGEHEERIPAKTIIWAAGVLAASIAGRLAEAAGANTDAVGRIVVEPDLTVAGHPEVIAIGDMVKVRSEPPYPGVAPVAMQMGRYAAGLVRARLRGARAGDFAYKDKGNRKEAVAAFEAYLKKKPDADDKKDIEDEIYDLQH